MCLSTIFCRTPQSPDAGAGRTWASDLVVSARAGLPVAPRSPSRTAADIAAHDAVLQTCKRHWPASKILKTIRGWMFPYFKCRIRPGIVRKKLTPSEESPMACTPRRPWRAMAVVLLASVLTLSLRPASGQEPAADSAPSGHESIDMSMSMPDQRVTPPNRPSSSRTEEEVSSIKIWLVSWAFLRDSSFLGKLRCASAGRRCDTLGLPVFYLPVCSCSSPATRSSGPLVPRAGRTVSLTTRKTCSTRFFQRFYCFLGFLRGNARAAF